MMCVLKFYPQHFILNFTTSHHCQTFVVAGRQPAPQAVPAVGQCAVATTLLVLSLLVPPCSECCAAAGDMLMALLAPAAEQSLHISRILALL